MNPIIPVVIYIMCRFVAWVTTMHFLFYSLDSMTPFTKVAVGFFMLGYALKFLSSITMKKS